MITKEKYVYRRFFFRDHDYGGAGDGHVGGAEVEKGPTVIGGGPPRDGEVDRGRGCGHGASFRL
jgi:hypothetical protein